MTTQFADAVTLLDEDEEELLAASDPWFYGYRPVRRVLPNGEEDWEDVPLTEEDVMYPQVEDRVTITDQHERICEYLKGVLAARVAATSGAVVVGDLRIAWGMPGVRPMGPDVALLFGIRERQNWNTLHVAKEGARVALVVEVTLPATRRVDLQRKVDAYARARVPLYIIVDLHQRKMGTVRRLLGYELTPSGDYAPLAPDEDGRLWLEPLWATGWGGAAPSLCATTRQASRCPAILNYQKHTTRRVYAPPPPKHKPPPLGHKPPLRRKRGPMQRRGCASWKRNCGGCVANVNNPKQDKR